VHQLLRPRLHGRFDVLPGFRLRTDAPLQGQAVHGLRGLPRAVRLYRLRVRSPQLHHRCELRTERLLRRGRVLYDPRFLRGADGLSARAICDMPIRCWHVLAARVLPNPR
jgi:hypothetical protein